MSACGDGYQTGKGRLFEIHGDVAVAVTGTEEGLSIANIMTEAIELEVPSRCDIGLGASWGEAE